MYALAFRCVWTIADYSGLWYAKSAYRVFRKLLIVKEKQAIIVLVWGTTIACKSLIIKKFLRVRFRKYALSMHF